MMRIGHFILLTFVYLLASTVVFAENQPSSEISNNTGQGLQAAGNSGNKHAPDLKATESGFGQLLDGIGNSIKKLTPDLEKAGNQAGDALQGAGQVIEKGTDKAWSKPNSSSPSEPEVAAPQAPTEPTPPEEW